jgi:hypothetical protein
VGGDEYSGTTARWRRRTTAAGGALRRTMVGNGERQRTAPWRQLRLERRVVRVVVPSPYVFFRAAVGDSPACVDAPAWLRASSLFLFPGFSFRAACTREHQSF